MGWYSFRVPSADTNRARWAVTDFWRALSRWGVHDAGELPRVKVVRPKWQRLCAGFAGYLTSLMALADLDSPEAAMNAALDVVCAREVPLGLGDGGRLVLERAGTGVLDRSLAAKRLHYAGFTMAG
jgi:hypothetical protein